MNFFKFLSPNWEILNEQNDVYHMNIDTHVDYHINYTSFCPIFLVNLKLHFHFFQIHRKWCLSLAGFHFLYKHNQRLNHHAES